MRYLILLLFTSMCFGQIEVKEIKQCEYKLIGKTSKLYTYATSLKECDEHYLLTYRNAEYQHIDDMVYVYIKKEKFKIDDLYDVMIKGFEDMPKNILSISIGDETIYLTYKRFMNKDIVKIIYEDNGILKSPQNMNKKMVQKLFGKSTRKKKKKK